MTALITATLITAFLIVAFVEVTARAAGPNLKVQTAETIVATWRCQDKIGVPRTRARSPWKHHSQGFRRAELARWQNRWHDCARKLHRQAERMRTLQTGISHYYRSQGVGAGPMTGHEGELERVGRRYGWSPYFLFAASVTESSGGLAACYERDLDRRGFNAWGLASCGTWNGVKPAVGNSWGQAFDFYARFLLGRVGVSSGWPHARTTYDFHGYAECSPCWGRKTAEHMRHLFGVGPEVRYAA